MQLYLRDELISFGKYQGKSFQYIIANDEEYIQWCIENIKGFALVENPEEKERIESLVKESHYGKNEAWPSISERMNISRYVLDPSWGEQREDNPFDDQETEGCSRGEFGDDCETLGLTYDDRCSYCIENHC